jgi:integrase
VSGPRRGRGEGGLFFDERRQRWIAEVTVGYDPRGKRVVRRRSGLTKTEARRRLHEFLRDRDDGLTVTKGSATVADAVQDWLAYGLTGRAPATVEKWGHLMRAHVVLELGRRRLHELNATDVDRWLAVKAATLSTSTLRQLHAGLSRAVRRAMARDLVRRNVVELCSVPTGQPGRPSKSLDLAQANAVLAAAAGTPLHAYVVTSLLLGARTEELRALTWDHVDLDGDPTAMPPRPPSARVWRSTRIGGDTKTERSRRTLALPVRVAEVLREHREAQQAAYRQTGITWTSRGYVFATGRGTALDAANVRRAFRAVLMSAGLDARAWTPRELRHSFVSLLSQSGVRIETIADLVGHTSTRVTELVYRHQLQPVLLDGAGAMDALFDVPSGVVGGGSHSVSHSPTGSEGR